MTRTFQFGVVAVALSVLFACSGSEDEVLVDTVAPVEGTVSGPEPPVTSATTGGPATLETLPGPAQGPFSSELVTDAGQQDPWTWSLTYPVISGPAGSAPINAAIEGWAHETLDAHMARPLDDLSGEGTSEAFTVDVTVSATEAGPLVSARLDGADYTGGAHGSAWTSAMAFDGPTGQEVSLDDGLSGDFLAVFEAAARQQLTDLYAQHGGGEADLEPYAAGLAAVAENYATWIPTRQGITIVFQQYQVGPYAIGMPEIVVPWASLDVRPDGPFASFT